MKKMLIKGEGVQGMCLTLSVCDMFAANQMANELKKVIDNHKNVDAYLNTPYDERKNRWPNGEPIRTHLDDATIEKLYTLMCKMSYSATTTLFADEDEPNGSDWDIDE